MGLVETLLEHVSLKGVLLSIPALFVAWLVYITLIIVSQNFKLARRGPRANSLPSRLPLGNSSSPRCPVSLTDALQASTSSTTRSKRP